MDRIKKLVVIPCEMEQSVYDDAKAEKPAKKRVKKEIVHTIDTTVKNVKKNKPLNRSWAVVN
jgi:hypothetical protein